ncbi:DsbA family protein [Brevundimonas mediterranea]|uniref:Protein-disulfide isomerase n=1 Tax=Brevundimonas mediterranea TaxID=74329 RepID=A0A7W6F0J8_9CAUL|nr:DsbA family protein [Brevundimonas mediterranea]MBB3873176.1 protein-disulfide isomerase [Brevundimonas mediterranea]
MNPNIFVPTRRSIIAVGAGALITACAPQAAEADDMVLGRQDAPVTLIEYASSTCGPCARFAIEVLPELRRRYMDTGQVKLIYREFITGPANLSAAGVLLARCAGSQRYFEVIDALMHGQSEWTGGQSPRAHLVRVAGRFGIDEARLKACIADPDAMAALERRVRRAQDAGVTGTPTLFVQGRRVDGPLTLDSVVIAIDTALSQSSKP